MGSFDETEYRHRFAAWSAATAARASPSCRFTVEEGRKIIEEVKLKMLSGPDGWINLPDSDKFDGWHEEKRNNICNSDAVNQIISRKDEEEQNFCFSQGVAAKLINVYLKVLFLGGVHEEKLSATNQQRRDAIHPPIDSLLLTGLQQALRNDPCIKDDLKEEVLRLTNKKWSKLKSCEYQEIICMFLKIIRVKNIVPGEEGLWTIEKYWQGNQ